MKISARSVLMAGVATLTASAVVIAPSVQPPPPPAPADDPTGGGRPAAGATGPAASPHRPARTHRCSCSGPQHRLGTLPAASRPLRNRGTHRAESIANTIDSIYIAVEPWVHYGFEVATAAVALDPVCRLVRRLIMDRLLLRRKLGRQRRLQLHRLASTATAASSRTWSISASTSASHSSGWDSTR